jgi:hypothetical protein
MPPWFDAQPVFGRHHSRRRRNFSLRQQVAAVRYERGLACYEDCGYFDHAAEGRDLWESAAKAS